MNEREKGFARAPRNPCLIINLLCDLQNLRVGSCMAQYWRNPNYNWLRMQIAVVVALIFSTSFIDSGAY